MKRAEVRDIIREIGIIPAIRVSSAEEAHFACDVVARSGIPIVEVTMTVPEAVELIAHLVQHHQTILVGAGSVLNAEIASKCFDAGAHFLTSPGLNLKVVEFAAKKEIVVLPGALTPTEVMEAWDAGSDFVKVFPCVDIGGARYIRALKTSLPQIPLIAAGGVTQQTATSFLLAGATAIGVGTELIPADAIANRESDRIRELSHRFLGYVKDARRRLGPDTETSTAAKTDFWKLHKRAKSDTH
jgi:2-dehydro-3-deoxyphosphogluconate aldolase / (4S)-4-hydroxy-2-oxoglutarate aldolase